MSNLAQRLLTAAVAIPGLIAAILWSQPWAVDAIVLLATAIGLREWARMTLPTAPVTDKGFLVVAGLGLAVAVRWGSGIPMVSTVATAFAVIAAFLWFLFRYGTIEEVAARVAFTIAGWFYVLLVLFLCFMKDRPDGPAWILISLSLAWGSDTGAYFAGRFLGPRWPRKLYEAVSPKKTVVGAVGGVVAAWVFVAIAKVWYGPYWQVSLSWLDTVLIAVVANVLGQLGDLAESLIKRSVGVKDSGALLPGHGGMLDRIDALIFVVPYIYAYARWVLGTF